MPEIARQLNVDAVVEGAVVRDGDQVRITAQLIAVAPERHMWAQSYERNLSDIVALQGEVARAIASEIKAAVTPEEEARLASARPVNPEAYEAYLKGRYFWNKRTREGLTKGLEHFQQAIDIDPTYALAYAGVADSWLVLGNNAYLPAEETFPKAKTAALKALAIDDSLAEAHTSLGAILQNYDWDWTGAEREFRRALQLNPGYATAHHWNSFLLSMLGRHDEAIAEVKRARELDPLSLRINANVGLMFYWARRYDQAIKELLRALELDQNRPRGLYDRLGWAYLQKDMHDEAIATLEKALTLSGGGPLALAGLGHAYAVAGRVDDAISILGKLKRVSKRSHVSPVWLARIYTGLGEKDQAFAWLEKGYEKRDIRMHWMKLDPRFDPLRSDPRFQDLLRRMNFPD
ncbi:MAG: tetratricopeptide repeat protein [Phycisphaerae bacterium]